jgi:peroxiredoxin
MDEPVATPAARRINADPFLLVLLALSLAANVWLGLKVRRAAPAGPPEVRLHVGDTLPALEVLDAEGRPATLRADDDPRPTVFYLYSHTCGWCQRNQPAVTALAEQAGERFRLVGLCLGRPEDCARREGDPPFPLYSGLKPRQIADLGLGSVPQTIVVSPGGQIAQIFRGAWVQSQRDDVQGYFKVALPVLEPRPAALSDTAAH